MILSEVFKLVPAGMTDHVRVYQEHKRINDIDAFMLNEVRVLAPSLHAEISKCMCKYDCYIDVYISNDQLTF